MFHQQQRAAAYMHMNPAIQAALNAGAAYACLSGAGPSVIAFVPGRVGDSALAPEDELLCNVVGKAMVEAASSASVAGRFIVTNCSERGVHVVA